MIDRRSFIALAGGSLLAPAARAQPVEKVWRIGLLGIRVPVNPEHAASQEAFKQVLHERGYVEGKNLVYERRYAEGNVERAAAFAAEFVRLNVDLITVSAGSTAVRAAMEATKTIPIVMVGASNPVEFGLIASLARPGGNVTGVADLQLDLLAKRLEMLKAAAPAIQRVVYIRGPATAFTAMMNERAAVSAKTLGIQVLTIGISPSQSNDELAAAINAERPDALLLAHHVSIGAREKEIAQFAIKQRLPTLAAQRGYVEAGILMSYGHTAVDMSRSAAVYVDKIFRGAKPSELPVEQPTKFELVINLKTTKAIGLVIPQSVLRRADEVIE